MERKERKPPISVNELREEEEPRRGSLTYMGSPTPNKMKGGTNYTQIFISVVLSALLAFLLITSMASSKKDAGVLLDNQRGLEAKIASLEGKVASETARVEAVVGTQSEYVKTSQLSGYVTSSSIDPLRDLPTQLASLDAKLTALDTKITGLETKIADLEREEQAPPPSSGTDGLGLEVKEFYSEDEPLFTIPKGVGVSYSETSSEICKLKVTNKTTSKIEDVILVLEVEINPALKNYLEGITVTFEGWRISSSSGNILRFRSNRFNLDAGKDKTWYVELEVRGTTSQELSKDKEVWIEEIECSID